MDGIHVCMCASGLYGRRTKGERSYDATKGPDDEPRIHGKHKGSQRQRHFSGRLSCIKILVLRCLYGDSDVAVCMRVYWMYVSSVCRYGV